MEEKIAVPSTSPDPQPFIVPQKEALWGFAYLRPRTEKKFAQKLTDRGVRSYLPLIRKVRIHNRGKVVSSIPMFVGYVFLEIPNRLYTDILRLSDVITLDLPEEPEIQKGLVEDLNRVRKFELFSDRHKVVVNPGIQPGMTVLIKSGPLKGIKVVVEKRVDEIHVIVNLNILGRHCACTINADELREIT
ncbi:MAG: transcription termination/antitermination protein NusG [Thermoguttaceae bacterium]